MAPIKIAKLDGGFLALAFAFLVIGAAGVVLFNGALTPSLDSCYCIIPTPEPGAAQGTSSILLVLGILFVPIGLLKGGPPSFGRRMPGATQPIPLPGGKVYAPLGIKSGSLYTLGITGIIIGVDFLAIPGFLLFSSPIIGGAGVALAVLGAFATYLGSKKSA